MTAGMMIMGIGAAILGMAFLMMVITAVTAPARKRKIEQRMKEIYG